MSDLIATFDITPVDRLTWFVNKFNIDNKNVFEVFNTSNSEVEGESQSIMAFIGFLAECGEDSLICVI